MASLDRAYGVRGAAIALGMATIAGGVHGILAASFDVLWVKLAVGTAGALVLIMAGAISARQSLPGALGLGLSMGALFITTRWSGWSLMEGGFEQLASFLTTPPWTWPAYLAAAEISGFWLVETVSVLVPALLGCFFGQERAS